MVERGGLKVEVIGVNRDEQSDLSGKITDTVPAIYTVTKDGALGPRRETTYNAEALARFIESGLAES